MSFHIWNKIYRHRIIECCLIMSWHFVFHCEQCYPTDACIFIKPLLMYKISSHFMKLCLCFFCPRVYVATILILFFCYFGNTISWYLPIVFFPVPGSVISPVAYSFGENWISLRWKAPYPPHGQLKNYEVEYKLQSDWTYKKKKNVEPHNSKCTFWDGNICFRLSASDGITKNKEYDIRVSDNCSCFMRHYISFCFNIMMIFIMLMM
jgi:hypothetical protein